MISVNNRANVSWQTILADSDHSICDLLPYARTPTVRRQRSVNIVPGESVQDLLVFEAPPAGFKHLLLVLPLAALGAHGQLAIEIPCTLITVIDS